MPIYTYKCKEETCAHTFEELVALKGKEPTLCPKCGVGSKIEKVITPVMSIFKGTGWTSGTSLG